MGLPEWEEKHYEKVSLSNNAHRGQDKAIYIHVINYVI
jgi:hypothetical protein